MAVLLPIAIQNEVFVHISEVDRGLDCNCTCPECGNSLVARKGREREHHFAHVNTADMQGCGGDIESALHRYAKQLIIEAGYLAVPPFEITLPPPDSDLKDEVPAKRITFTRVEIEESMVVGRRKVDVVGYTNNSRLLIEIYVTHRVRGKKLREVRVANEAMLEIEVRRDRLYSQASEGDESLRQCILDSFENKRWLCHPEGESIRARLEKQAHERRIALPLPQSMGQSVLTPLQQAESSSPNRGNHFPARNELSEEDYVRELCKFFDGARYDEPTRQRIIRALRFGGNITVRDIEIAALLGIDHGLLRADEF
jgi:hypothetical protein